MINKLSIIVIFLILFGCKNDQQEIFVFKKPLSKRDYKNIKFKLEKIGIKYILTDEGFIYVSDEITARKLRTLICMENLIKDFEIDVLYNFKNYPKTGFENITNRRRNIRISLENHLKTLKYIKQANLIITKESDRPYYLKTPDFGVEALLIISVKNNVDFLNNKKIFINIRNYISKGLSSLGTVKPEDIFIMNYDGNLLNHESEINYEKKKHKIKNNLKFEYFNKIYQKLSNILNKDKFEIYIKVELNTTTKQHVNIEKVYTTVIFDKKYILDKNIKNLSDKKLKEKIMNILKKLISFDESKIRNKIYISFIEFN